MQDTRFPIQSDVNSSNDDSLERMPASASDTAKKRGDYYSKSGLFLKPSIKVETSILEIKKGISALHYAAKHGSEPLFRKLLQKGGDLNAVDKSGNNALFFAIVGRNKEIVNRLLNMNYFTLSHTNGSGESAFYIAQRYGMHDIVQRINKGRNI